MLQTKLAWRNRPTLSPRRAVMKVKFPYKYTSRGRNIVVERGQPLPSIDRAHSSNVRLVKASFAERAHVHAQTLNGRRIADLPHVGRQDGAFDADAPDRI